MIVSSLRGLLEVLAEGLVESMKVGEAFVVDGEGREGGVIEGAVAKGSPGVGFEAGGDLLTKVVAKASEANAPLPDFVGLGEGRLIEGVELEEQRA
jgi:hypothetical protein